MADYQGRLPIKTVSNGEVVAKICDTAGVNTLVIDTNGAIGVTGSVDANVTNTVTVSGSVDANVTNTVTVSGSVDANVTNTVTVSATDLDIRNLTASDQITIASGTNTLAIDSNGAAAVTVSSGSISIVQGTNTLSIDTNGAIKTSIVPVATTAVFAYATEANVTNGGSKNIEYTVTTGKTFTGATVLAGCRGAVKVAFGIADGTNYTPYGVYFQQPAENDSVSISSLSLVGDGTKKVRLTVTNLDDTTDVYGTIQGTEQ